VKVDVGLEIREVRPEELGQAVAVTARGMRDNPTHIEAFGRDDDTREHRLGALFGSVLPIVSAKAVLIGAYREGELVGIAGVAGPGQCRPSASESLRMLPRLLPRVGPGSLMRMGTWMRTWAQHDPAERHWHLGPVAVDRPLQGRGIGSAILEEVCARMDRQGSLLYLETDKPENVRFYQRYGFETVGQGPVLGVTNWYMQRAART
jgi:GNAT superfamily N-acetyltransferase